MIIREKFGTEEEKELLIEKYNNLYIIKLEVSEDESYITFSDVPLKTMPTWEEEVENKISILEAENEKLKVEQEQQNEEILVNMLANTEMFEMLLGMMPMTLSIEDKNTKNNGGSRGICDIYASLIEKGVKTINDVPVQIVEQVKNKLEL